jgi:glycosyltransferase involved in cell wall biosynthesis
MKNKTLFIYNDSHIVGGHEILTVRIANYLAETHQLKVHFAFFCQDISGYLSEKIIPHVLPFHSKTKSLIHRGQFDIAFVKNLIVQIKPDLALIAQGYIESGVRGILGARLSGTRTVSYIPFGETNKELGNRYAAFRDLLAIPIYKLNHHYITISKFQARALIKRVGARPVEIINNPLSDQPIKPITPKGLDQARQSGQFSAAVIGRILFKQKNQNILIAVAQMLKQQGLNVTFNIIGDGPDRAQLESQIQEHHLQNSFKMHGWMEKNAISKLLETEVDFVVMPSKYEGLPLVFLETVFSGLPILMSDLGFTTDYPIPDSWRFNPGSADSIVESIASLVNSETNQAMLRLQESVATTNSLSRFNQDITDCFSKLLP